MQKEQRFWGSGFLAYEPLMGIARFLVGIEQGALRRLYPKGFRDRGRYHIGTSEGSLADWFERFKV